MKTRTFARNGFHGFSEWVEAYDGDPYSSLIARLIAERLKNLGKTAGNLFDVSWSGSTIYVETLKGSDVFINVHPDKINLYLRGSRTVLYEYDVPTDKTPENTAIELADSLMTYLTTVFMLAEVQPPFIDLSVKRPLGDSDLARIDELFSIVDPKEYAASGSFNILTFKRSKDTNDNINDRLISRDIHYSTGQIIELPKLKNPRVVYFKGPESGYLYYNMREMRRSLLDVRWNGRDPHEEDNYRVVWGTGHDEEDLMYEQTNNICDYVSYLARGADGNLFWTTLYAIPSFPSGFETVFLDKLESFIVRLDPPKIEHTKVDMITLMRRFWDSNLDEQFFTGGFIYYRDGFWGAYYDVAGHGAGNLLQNNPRELYFAYTFVPPEANKDGSGFIRLLTDSNNAKRIGVTWTPGWVDVLWRFYPNQDQEQIIRAVRNYTHSY